MLSNRVNNITPSMTLGISTKVKELSRAGIEVLNLSIGEPDFFTPDGAKDSAIEAIHSNKTKYDAATGVLELRQAICKKLEKENSISYRPEEIVVSSGAKHSITNTLMAITNPGDEVIVPIPYWVSYPEMVKLTEGVPVFVETEFENNFKLKPQELRNAITDKTKAIFITNPSNPTGAVYTKDELKALADICVQHGIYIIADEIYERMCYLDEFTSIASLSEEIKEITITINGLSKSVSMTGWRVGYTASRADIAKGMGSIQGHLVSHPSTISQYAAIGGLTNCDDDIAHMKSVYKQRKDQAIEWIEAIEGLSVVKPDGAFYIFINIGPLRDKIDSKDLSLTVCNRLLDEYKVAFVPGVAFGHDDFIRMSYATDLDTIKEGIERLKNLVDTL
ncbi:MULTISPECIES: pyridoxal phosphate-dependent aminotransferase [unclassified Fusibacter]|uniref:pyridoxal phosphate-dependent aminotransferase n=1 Tax=unclassified Fusibacter TaxID=2624464 RepID=UPI001013AF62|nr:MULTISPECIES: pyridoxal phosphate-dependent aminotransferase [unclassified Fusibacter]MCK8059213.1 pyridoxal phosphate-dependent aminotransferase [Fusibacter sp. A2]NPE21324.1 pyridoxal phosphate-dependent aminotransferase [Fusibacter sp. A1]RXV62587.1 pyridoxal phosphate-dependent aminotransferase [Fusibacter sp. A1]